jgi:4-hydroxybenzoate polyprenyltransferase
MTSNKNVTLCVDLDRTLIKTDILIESILSLLRNNVWSIFLLPFWLLNGKAYFKAKIAENAKINVTTLPYNEELVRFLTNKKKNGVDVVLVTATNLAYAEQVANYLDIFSNIVASNNKENIKGVAKRDKLESLYGKYGYDYIEDSKDDIPVWKSAGKCIFVGNSRDKRIFEGKKITFESFFDNSREGGYGKLIDYIKGIRVHQWAKNTLIFVPLFLTHGFHDKNLLLISIITFLSFSFAASANYLINDLIDLELDRSHPTKKNRALASGNMFIGHAILSIPILLVISYIMALLVSPLLPVLLLVYLLVTFLYSIFLKKILIIDVITLAGLYTARIIVGVFAIQGSLSFWLLSFSMFLFFSLALVKRCVELKLIESKNKTSTFIDKKISGRGYWVGDAPILYNLGVASGLLAVLVFALYINSQEVSVLYGKPEILWLALPVLFFWISRIWVLTYRGVMHEDPVLFAIHDKVSLTSIVVVLAILWTASVYI